MQRLFEYVLIDVNDQSGMLEKNLHLLLHALADEEERIPAVWAIATEYLKIDLEAKLQW